ncbi:QRFP-like peptide receptor isoform X2 [Octopus bimaculoides]|uniref:G-protein coupled receptors family 1 profile domain-containing protein n=1 Tax=Octopus bimaculoides TaxID=37653 RepID=A0A0L8GU33_OCTBM|nr:QRFP-like peptide receptor isoform X2 [Octopus bimaculoides]
MKTNIYATLNTPSVVLFTYMVLFPYQYTYSQSVLNNGIKTIIFLNSTWTDYEISSWNLTDDNVSNKSRTPLSSHVIVNSKSEMVTTEENSTSQTVPLSEMCKIAEEYSNWNFEYKYSVEYLKEVVCKCYGACNMVKPDMDHIKKLKEEYENPLAPHNIVQFLLVMCSYSFLLLIGFIGNMTTICGLIFWVKSKAPTIYFILSLTSADLILVVVCIPIKLAETLKAVNNLADAVCKLMYYIRDFTFVFSIITMCVISLERYYAICHPLKAQYKCTKKRSIIIIVMIWCLSFVLASPTLVAMKTYLSNVNILDGYQCRQNFEKDVHLYAFFAYYLGILFFLPFLVMVFAYSSSCHSLWKSAQTSQVLQGIQTVSAGAEETTQNTKKGNDYKGRMKVIKMMILILVSFIIFWGPSMVYRIIMVKTSKNRRLLIQIFDGLVVVNSCTNPYIFMTMSSQFKTAAIKACSYGLRFFKPCCNIKDYASQRKFNMSRDYSSEISLSTSRSSISRTASEYY